MRQYIASGKYTHKYFLRIVAVVCILDVHLEDPTDLVYHLQYAGKRTGYKYNFILVNYYMDGNDSISYVYIWAMEHCFLNIPIANPKLFADCVYTGIILMMRSFGEKTPSSLHYRLGQGEIS